MSGSVDAVTQARKALELALRVGDVLLTAGMSANDVAVEMLRITEAYCCRATLGTYLGRPVKEQLRRIRNQPTPRPRSLRGKSQQTSE